MSKYLSLFYLKFDTKLFVLS